jgi:hypothetical protein
LQFKCGFNYGCDYEIVSEMICWGCPEITFIFLFFLFKIRIPGNIQKSLRFLIDLLHLWTPSKLISQMHPLENSLYNFQNDFRNIKEETLSVQKTRFQIKFQIYSTDSHANNRNGNFSKLVAFKSFICLKHIS